MREKTWTDESGSSLSVRSGAVGYDIDARDADGRVINVSLPYDGDFPTEITFMYVERDGGLPDVDPEFVTENQTIARRIYIAHEAGHSVGLDQMADGIVMLYRLAQEDQRYATVLAALMGAADDLLD